MKNIIFALFALMFLACAGSNEKLILPKNQVNTTVALKDKKITLYVNDERENTKIIGSITNAGGSLNTQIEPNESLGSWFYTAIKDSLERRGVSVSADESIVDFVAIVNIKECKTSIDGVGTENMKGNCELEIVIKKDYGNIKKRISQPQKDFAVLPRLSALEEFTASLLKDMAERSAKEIASSY